MNTPSKRASAIGIGLAIRLVLPVPDGSIGQADRQTVAYSYAGILATELVPPPDVTYAGDVVVDAASQAVAVVVSPVTVASVVSVDTAQGVASIAECDSCAVNVSVDSASLAVDVLVD